MNIVKKCSTAVARRPLEVTALTGLAAAVFVGVKRAGYTGISWRSNPHCQNSLFKPSKQYVEFLLEDLSNDNNTTAAIKSANDSVSYGGWCSKITLGNSGGTYTAAVALMRSLSSLDLSPTQLYESGSNRSGQFLLVTRRPFLWRLRPLKLIAAGDGITNGTSAQRGTYSFLCFSTRQSSSAEAHAKLCFRLVMESELVGEQPIVYLEITLQPSDSESINQDMKSFAEMVAQLLPRQLRQNAEIQRLRSALYERPPPASHGSVVIRGSLDRPSLACPPRKRQLASRSRG